MIAGRRAAHPLTTDLTQRDPVQAWREQRMLELGYNPEIAEVLAIVQADWHDLERMLKAGCPLDTAIRILA